MGDVAGEFGALPRRIDAHQRRAAQCRTREPEKIFRLVLQQHADVERAVDAQAGREPGADGGLRDEFAPRPPGVLEQQGSTVVGGAREQPLGHPLGKAHAASSPANKVTGPCPVSYNGET